MRRSRPSVALFAPRHNAPSATFIQNHICNLPYQVFVRHGTELRIENEQGNLIWPTADLCGRLLCKIRPSLRRHYRDFLIATHLRNLGVDAVLAEYGVTGCWLEEACRMADIPLIVHFHGFDASIIDVIKKHQECYRSLFRKSHAIIAVSKAMEKRLHELGAPREKVFLSPCGVDGRLFAQGNPGSQPRHFLVVGRLVEKKAPYLTLLAFNEVLRIFPDSTMTIIGDGPLKGPCKRLIESLEITASVELLGTRPSSEVADLMQKSRAFVQHSLQAENGDCEGTPVAIVEAQMSGLPVVATNHAGIPDVVEDRVTGFIVEEADVRGMATAMIKLAGDPQLASQMGKAARQRAVMHFTLERHINDLSKIIDMAISVRTR